MAVNHTIRYHPGDTYSRTFIIRRRLTATTTEPYDLTGYVAEFDITEAGEVVPELIPTVTIEDADGGLVSFAMSAALTTALGEITTELRYYIRLSLNTDDVVLTALNGRVVNDD